MATQRSTNNIDIPNRHDPAWPLTPGGYNAQVWEPEAFKAGAAISQFRFVKAGADATHLIQAAAATDTVLGIYAAPQNANTEDKLDVVYVGRTILEVGTAGVSFGDRLTSDSVGRAVTAATGNKIGAVALATGTVGQFIPVVLAPGGALG
jgi:hypothetical protein